MRKKLNYHQKTRTTNKLVLYYFDKKDKNGNCKFLYIDENKLGEENSYFIALNFNKEIIKNLTEKSKLTEEFIQLDVYILKNYFFKEANETYSLINESLIIMKQHLLNYY